MAYLGEDIKKLGFGLMRLPMLDKEVDIEQTKKMVDIFIANGFTYFDTAYGYIGGKSEMAVKTALVDRYPRENFQLATKLPAWAGAKNADEAKNMFYTSLERTGAGYFDFYLLHNLGGDRTEIFEHFGIWDFVHELRDKGLIKHLGFSFHDKADKLELVLKAHPEVEFVQLQINYADWEDDGVQSRKCYETARKYGKPVIIMEPIKGGSLANLTENASAIFKEADPSASIASWALRFAASLEGIVTVLSGMSNLSQMEENVKLMRNFSPLSDSERNTVKAVQSKLREIPQIPCTACGYCTKGCPSEINIPGVFKAMNNYLIYGNLEGAKGNYGWETRNGSPASKCVECGQCESVCPQHIKIIDELKKASATLE